MQLLDLLAIIIAAILPIAMTPILTVLALIVLTIVPIAIPTTAILTVTTTRDIITLLIPILYSAMTTLLVLVEEAEKLSSIPIESQLEEEKCQTADAAIMVAAALKHWKKRKTLLNSLVHSPLIPLLPKDLKGV